MPQLILNTLAGIGLAVLVPLFAALAVIWLNRIPIDEEDRP